MSVLNLGVFTVWLMSSVVSTGLQTESTAAVIKTVENSQRVMVGTDSSRSPPPSFLSSRCQLSVMSVSVLMMLPHSAPRTVAHLSPPNIGLFACKQATDVVLRHSGFPPLTVRERSHFGALRLFCGSLWSLMPLPHRRRV